MPNINRISAILTAAAQTAIAAAVTALKTNMPFLINLLPDERKKKRKTGTKREGYVVAVYQAVLAHPEAIPATFSVPEWTKDEELNDALKLDYSSVLAVAESIDDTLLQLGSERIQQADTCYDYLKRAAKDNAALSTIVDNIAKQFLGQGRKGDVPITSIPAGGSVSVANAVPNTNMSNMGNTILKLSANGIDTLVRPGDVAKVPVKNIMLTNQSSTEAGSFSVKTK